MKGGNDMINKLDKNSGLGSCNLNKRQGNKTAIYEFTIVVPVPVFNEEDNIYALEEKLSSFVSQSSLSACVLFVNDCSTDQSKDRIVAVCSRQKNFYHLSLTKNSGLSVVGPADILMLSGGVNGTANSSLSAKGVVYFKSITGLW